MLKFNSGWVENVIQGGRDNALPLTVQIYDLEEARILDKDCVICKVSDTRQWWNGVYFMTEPKFNNYDIIEANRYDVINIDGQPVIVLAELNAISETLDKVLGEPSKARCAFGSSIPRVQEDVKEYPKVKTIAKLDEHETNWYMRVQVIEMKPIRSFVGDVQLNEKLRANAIVLKIADSKKGIMYAVLFQRGFTKHCSLLKDNAQLKITRATLAPTPAIYTSCDTKYYIVLDENSDVQAELFNPIHPWKQPEYISITQVPKGNLTDTYDVVGVVEEVGRKREFKRNERTSYRRYVTLGNGKKTTITLALWGEHTDKDVKQGQIIGVTEVEPKIFRNRREINSTGNTSIEVDPTTPLLTEIRQALEARPVIPFPVPIPVTASRVSSTGSRMLFPRGGLTGPPFGKPIVPAPAPRGVVSSGGSIKSRAAALERATSSVPRPLPRTTLRATSTGSTRVPMPSPMEVSFSMSGTTSIRGASARIIRSPLTTSVVPPEALLVKVPETTVVEGPAVASMGPSGTTGSIVAAPTRATASMVIQGAAQRGTVKETAKKSRRSAKKPEPSNLPGKRIELAPTLVVRELLLSELIQLQNDETKGPADKRETYAVKAEIINYNYNPTFFYVGCQLCKMEKDTDQCPACCVSRPSEKIYNFLIEISDEGNTLWVSVSGIIGTEILGMPVEEMSKTVHPKDWFGFARGRAFNFLLSLECRESPRREFFCVLRGVTFADGTVRRG